MSSGTRLRDDFAIRPSPGAKLPCLMNRPNRQINNSKSYGDNVWWLLLQAVADHIRVRPMTAIELIAIFIQQQLYNTVAAQLPIAAHQLRANLTGELEDEGLTYGRQRLPWCSLH